MKIEWFGQQVSLHPATEMPPLDPEFGNYYDEASVNVLGVCLDKSIFVVYASRGDSRKEIEWRTTGDEFFVTDCIIGWIELPTISD